MPNSDESVLNYLGQMLAAAILIPLQAICIAGIAKIVCECWLLHDVTANDFWALMLTLVFLGFVSHSKHRLKIHWVLVEFATAAIAIAVCLKELPLGA